MTRASKKRVALAVGSPAKLDKPAKKSRWERAADRQNARIARDNPLFVRAGIAPLTTAAGQQARVEKIVNDFDARIAAGEVKDVERAAELRAQVAALVSWRDLLELDVKRLNYPKTGIYAVEHWQGELARLRPAVVTATSAEPTAAPPRPAVQLVLGEAPALVNDEGPVEVAPRVRPPCGECGWIPGSGYHPGDCAALRALQWKLGRCADCNASPAGGCAAHVAEVKRIDAGDQEEPIEFPRRAGLR